MDIKVGDTNHQKSKRLDRMRPTFIPEQFSWFGMRDAIDFHDELAVEGHEIDDIPIYRKLPRYQENSEEPASHASAAKTLPTLIQRLGKAAAWSIGVKNGETENDQHKHQWPAQIGDNRSLQARQAEDDRYQWKHHRVSVDEHTEETSQYWTEWKQVDDMEGKLSAEIKDGMNWNLIYETMNRIVSRAS